MFEWVGGYFSYGGIHHGYRVVERTTFGCFLDVEKPFDSVWHDALLFKLWEVELLGCYLHLIASVLMERTFCVRVGESVSSERRITPSNLKEVFLAHSCSQSMSTTCQDSLESRWPYFWVTRLYLQPITTQNRCRNATKSVATLFPKRWKNPWTQLRIGRT